MPNIQKNQHVVPVNGNWGVKGEGNSRYTKIFEKQVDAYEYARNIARNQKTEVLLHNRKGQIRARETFGNDPTNPKDKEH